MNSGCDRVKKNRIFASLLIGVSDNESNNTSSIGTRLLAGIRKEVTAFVFLAYEII